MLNCVIGIDPGVSGALVALDTRDLSVVKVLLMPVTHRDKAKKCDGVTISHWLDSLDSIVGVGIERVASMPKQGVASSFNFGHSAGLIQGVVNGKLLKNSLITPQKWKKHAGLIGKPKDAARTQALELYPQIKELSLIGKGQAIADALFIARYAHQHFLN